jgi:hypothetical protein
MDQASAVLREDHNRLQRLLTEFGQDAGSSSANIYRRRRGADALVAEFSAHLEIEQHCLDPVLRELPADKIGLVEQEAADRDQARQFMQTLLDADPQDARFAAAAADLRARIVRHIARQDGEVFPVLSAVGPERLAELGEQLRQASSHHLMHPNPSS